MFDTSLLDKAIKERRKRLEAERADLIGCVRRTLLEQGEHSEPTM